ncbi:NADP-dependent oxidoreductase [Phytohabitans sp. LJ34]|uniref:NADP-dependent oxidoreductase n=1 Tax=Phytohabitans sp. LJ34 TaxID=3452217 RepID=UPI003F8CDD75
MSQTPTIELPRPGTPLTGTMRAVLARSFGGPDVLEIADVPRPVPGPGELLVKVMAAPVTPVDLDMRSGELSSLLEPRDAYPLGRCASGTVAALGPGVDGFRVNDRVIGMVGDLNSASAAQAEWVVLPASATAHAPKTVSAVHASTIPLNALTAHQALDVLDLRPGQSVLVTGATGAVGGFAVELAVRRGLKVYALARGSDEVLVRNLGAHHFVPRGGTLPSDVDGVLDAAVLGAQVMPAVRDGGRFVALVYGGAPQPARGIAVTLMWTRADGARLASLVDAVDAAALTPRVAGIYTFDAVARAHERFAQGRLRGHLVLVP